MSSRAPMLYFHWGTADGVEDINRYAPGGFHPVHLGNTFKSDKATYRVLNKLGHGSFFRWELLLPGHSFCSVVSRFFILS
ncbi:hypothetical protein BDZ97DRAFT_1813604 [Flammula alnicola]|nr:hypothetical protein BDZ97DRAFT_1813604 [Flammula alnicola]